MSQINTMIAAARFQRRALAKAENPKDIAQSATRRLPSIQYLRAVAALMVVLFHVTGQSAIVGAAGVDIFFVVSGFVMWIVIDGENVNPLRFAYDRGARILPLYWLCTLLLASAAILHPDLFSRLRPNPEWLVYSLALLPSYQPGTANIYPILSQGWTLCYEMFFYAILFVATLAPRPRRALIVSASLLAFIAVGFLYPSKAAAAQVYTSPLLAEFLLGLWFGKLFSSNRFSTLWVARLLIAIGLAGMAIAAYSGEDPHAWNRVIMWGMPAFALVAGFVSLEKARGPYDFRIGRLLGDASYSIYLTHGLFISVLTHLWKVAGADQPASLNAMAFAAIGLLVCTVGGTLVHLSLERPITKALQRSPWTPSRFLLAGRLATTFNYKFSHSLCAGEPLGRVVFDLPLKGVPDAQGREK